MAVNTKKFSHSTEVQKINTNLMRGCKANSAVVPSMQRVEGRKGLEERKVRTPVGMKRSGGQS